MFCRTYDFCLLCSCQSSEKKIEKKKESSFFSDCRGNDMKRQKKED